MNVGSHIGQYRIVRKIGAGGMGTVFVGEHILLGRQAAIKTLLPSLSAQVEVVERFFREARAASAVNDPGVVQIFDFGYHVDGTAYIVMELLEGESLSGRLRRLGVLPPVEALRIGRQIAGALSVVHAAGIVHRDLKPENIFLIRDAEAQGGERAKLLDFGICKLGEEIDAKPGTTLGTPLYMAPEQCTGSEVDGRADLYGLGCVLLQMLTGRVPFEHADRELVMKAHVLEAPPIPSQRVPELMPLIDEIIEHCLAKSPDERYQSMTALQHVIDQILPQLTPVPLADAPIGVALGAGFKTNFDGNVRIAVPKLSSEWFIMNTPEPDTLQAATGQLAIPQPRGNRSMLAIVLSGALVALVAGVISQFGGGTQDAGIALAITNAIPHDEDGEAMPAPEPEPQPDQPEQPPADPEPEPTPDPNPLPPPSPPPPPPELIPSTDDPPDQDVAITHEVPTARAEMPKPAKIRSVAVRRSIAKSARPAARPAPKPPAPEDLYDTR